MAHKRKVKSIEEELGKDYKYLKTSSDLFNFSVEENWDKDTVKFWFKEVESYMRKVKN